MKSIRENQLWSFKVIKEVNFYQRHSTNYVKCMEYNDNSPLQIHHTKKKKNQNILDRARSMVANIQLPDFLWLKVVNITTYLSNHKPSKSNGLLIPKHIYIGKSTQPRHLEMFGCFPYIHISKTRMVS